MRGVGAANAGNPAMLRYGNAMLRRAIVVVDADRISDSCGFGVPVMEHVRERDNAERWARGQVEQGDDGLEDYKRRKNTTSIDGLPAWPGPGGDA